MGAENDTCEKKERLYCLDMLRGLDMMLLSVIGVVVMAAHAAWGLPQGFVAQFRHPWGGFTLWDIIMPLFIFMSGASVPLASRRRLTADGRPTAAYWKHLLLRVLMLWTLGMVVQGRLLTLDPMQISPYNNTLQTIAIAYLVASLAYLLKPKWVRPCLCLGLMAFYGVVLACFGDYSREGNAAVLVELKVLAVLVPDGSSAYNLGGYTWFLTSPVFAALGLAGCCSTELLLSRFPAVRKAVFLFAAGGMSWVAGHALGFVVPLIKQIFTVSFTAEAMGWCMMAFAVLYSVNDILKLRRGTGLIVCFGRHSLAAYLGRTVLWPVYLAAANVLSQGFPFLFGASFGKFATQALAALLLTGVIWWMDRVRNR